MSSFNIITWAEVERIGCGQTVCKVGTRNYLTLLCEYAAPYQMLLYDPLWLRGTPGSACPSGRTANADGK
jgi:hypothetical protein